MRVSDAERAQVADELAKHYADGRLDETEFNERLGRAMGAKTRADLAGLLSDLPNPNPIPPPVPAPPRRRPRAAGIALLALLVLSLATVTWQWHLPFLVFLLVGFMIWRRHHRHLHRCHGGHASHLLFGGRDADGAVGGGYSGHDHWL